MTTAEYWQKSINNWYLDTLEKLIHKFHCV